MNAHWLVLLCFTCPVSAYRLSQNGVVSPPDPFGFVGETVTLVCISNPAQGTDSSQNSVLSFEADTDLGARVIPPSMTERLNATTIEFTITDLGVWDAGIYTCIRTMERDHDSKVIGSQILMVDYEPEEVQNVMCHIYNWEKMECSWELGIQYKYPDNIEVALNWTIQRTTSSPSNGEIYKCPSMNTTSCVWDESIYHHGHRYGITIGVQTVVQGKVLKTSPLSNYTIETKPHLIPELHLDKVLIARALPAPVTDFKAVSSSSSCISLTWTHAKLRSRKPFFWAEFISQRQSNWTNVPPIPQNGTSSLVCGLIPNTNHTFRIRALPFPQHSKDLEMYGRPSQWSHACAKTMEDVPGTAPLLCSSCFYQANCPDGQQCQVIRIVWKKIAEENRYGILTEYKVNIRNESNVLESVIETVTPDKSSFSSLLLTLPRPDQDSLVSLAVGTKKGFGPASNRLYIGAIDQRPRAPPNFTVEVAHGEDLTYNLSWTSLPDLDPVLEIPYSGITVLWCEGKSWDLKCENNVEWINLSKDQIFYFLDLRKTELIKEDLLIGIAAEAIQFGYVLSSGIHWARCAYLRNQKPSYSPQNIRAYHENKEANALKVRWDKKDCAHERSLIIGFCIEYCLTSDGQECSGEMRTKNVSSPDTETVLNNLKANGKYIIRGMALSHAGRGPSAAISKELQSFRDDSSPSVGLLVAVITIISLALVGIVVGICYRICKQRNEKFSYFDDFMKPKPSMVCQSVKESIELIPEKHPPNTSTLTSGATVGSNTDGTKVTELGEDSTPGSTETNNEQKLLLHAESHPETKISHSDSHGQSTSEGSVSPYLRMSNLDLGGISERKMEDASIKTVKYPHATIIDCSNQSHETGTNLDLGRLSERIMGDASKSPDYFVWDSNNKTCTPLSPKVTTSESDHSCNVSCDSYFTLGDNLG